MIFLRPTIFVTSHYLQRALFPESESISVLSGKDVFVACMDEFQAVYQAGGKPIAGPPICDEEYVNSLIKHSDGLLLVGGSDVNPNYYNEYPAAECEEIVPARDEFELMLIRRAVEENIPLLGICRGLHLINIFFGGSLYQDYGQCDHDTFNHLVTCLPKWHYAHHVQIKEGSLLATALGKNNIKVNSLHHQVIKKVGKGLKVVARAEDSVIEALECSQYKFLLGVQWHPEMMFQKSKEQLELFKFFIQQVKK